MKAHRDRRVPQKAFSLLNWLTLLSVLFLFFILVIGFLRPFGCGPSSRHQRSYIVIKAVRSALEIYQEKFGSYPEVANPNATITLDGQTYLVGEAACLYQALSGDGFDQIKGRTGTSPAASNGEVDMHEARNITLENIPKEICTQTSGIYYLVDGYGHPIRFIQAAPTGKPTTVNHTGYDLWSYGEDDTHTTAPSLHGRAVSGGGIRLDAKWIKNW